MVESRDNSTGGHIKRTSDVVNILIEEIQKDKSDDRLILTNEFCYNIIKAAPMHDLGKIAVDDAILRKPGRFTDEEFEKMKTHAAEGARSVHEILKDTDDQAFHILAENVAHYHHERWDGSGYPKGLKGEEIPLLARIICCADSFDAMTSKRAYRDTMPLEFAKKELIRCSETQFDPRIVNAFLEVIANEDTIKEIRKM
ncbi:MAG: HD domain-containing protein, partial [Candidatus Riflebacteria bacterium]|nr:HD domain-containing protein [Candidatus Riflebacteria bacterium]